MKFLFCFISLFSLNLWAENSCKQEPRGVHYVNTDIQIEVAAAPGSKTSNYKKINAIGRQQAMRFCKEQGYTYLHAYYWKRLKQVKNNRKPYHLTNIQCSNKIPRNEHGAGSYASGNDSMARAHRTQYFLKEHDERLIQEGKRPHSAAVNTLRQMKTGKDLITLAMNMAYCSNRYTVIKKTKPTNNNDSNEEFSGSPTDS